MQKIGLSDIITANVNYQKKHKIIEEFKVHKTDTGSTDVQVALISKQIEELVGHLKSHPKDNHSRRGFVENGCRQKNFDELSCQEKQRRHNALAGNLT